MMNHVKGSNDMLILFHELLLVRRKICLYVIEKRGSIVLVSKLDSLDEPLAGGTIALRRGVKRVLAFLLLLDLLLVGLQVQGTCWDNALS